LECALDGYGRIAGSIFFRAAGLAGCKSVKKRLCLFFPAARLEKNNTYSKEASLFVIAIFFRAACKSTKKDVFVFSLTSVKGYTFQNNNNL
jgi:hypothetical protein